MALDYEFENESKRRITIDDLNYGNLFMYDHTLFMLLSDNGEYGFFYIDKEDENDGRYETVFVAVDLSEGTLKEFDGCECITLINKDLRVKINEQDLVEWIS